MPWTNASGYSLRVEKTSEAGSETVSRVRPWKGSTEPGREAGRVVDGVVESWSREGTNPDALVR
jgi:hypothetical protein